MIPLFSILVPAYQAEKTISRCLDSIFSQTFKNFEVIIINDGSRDKTKKICEEYASLYDNVRLYNQENLGISITRQKAVSLARGTYIQFIDADDWVESDLLETCVNILKRQSYDIIIFDFFEENITGLKYRLQRPTTLEKMSLIRDISSPKMLGVLWNKLIRRTLFDNLTFPNLQYCEDWCICVELFQKIKSIHYVNQAYYHYDVTIINNSLTRNVTKTTFISKIKYIEYLKSIDFDKKYSKEYDSQVANIAYSAIVNNIYSDDEFFVIFKNVSFVNNFNSLYKKLILILSTLFSLSFGRTIDSFIRKIKNIF